MDQNSESGGYEDEADIELGLGLGLSLGKGYYGKTKDGGFAGTKRSAPTDFVSSPPDVGGYSASAPPPAVSNQVVGWPPIKTYRMNSLVNQSKPANDEEDKRVGENESKKKTNHGNNNNIVSKNDSVVKETRRTVRGFVKVNMDGEAIGRKVDLNVHICYQTLALTLEDMFFHTNSTRSNVEKEEANQQQSKLLDGSSDFVLTYEDKEGDWMLVGDVPWGMFLSAVKRLRIMKTIEANGLGPRSQGGKERQKGKHI